MDYNDYVGRPFHANGRGPCYDCWGIVRAIYKDAYHIILPSYDNDYNGVKDAGIPALIESEQKQWKIVEAGKEQEGDIILFRIRNVPTHVGMVISPGKMIHSLAGSDVVIENYSTPIWDNRIAGIFRHTNRS